MLPFYLGSRESEPSCLCFFPFNLKPRPVTLGGFDLDIPLPASVLACVGSVWGPCGVTGRCQAWRRVGPNHTRVGGRKPSLGFGGQADLVKLSEREATPFTQHGAVSLVARLPTHPAPGTGGRLGL